MSMATIIHRFIAKDKGDGILYPQNLNFRTKFFMILATILIIIIGNIILLALPQTKGFLIDDLEASTIMTFDRIHYRLNSEYLLSFPNKGYLVPIEMNSNPLGFAIFAEGNIAYEDDVYGVKETYIFVQEEEYYDILGNLFLQNSDETFFVDTTNNALSSALETTAYLELPIGKKYYPMSEEQGNIIIYQDREFVNLTHNTSSVLDYNIYYLTAILHVLFLIALGYVILLITDKRVAPEINRSLDVKFVSYRPLQLVILTTFFWLGALKLNGDLFTVQILLMASMTYILYYLLKIDNKRPFDLRLINFSIGDFVILPIIIGLMGYLIFGNTSITLRYFSFDFDLLNVFFIITSFLWISFVALSFIPFILRELDYEKHENTLAIIYCLIVYFAFISISGRPFNLFTLLNGMVFIPLYTITLNMYGKRLYNFIPPLTTILVVKLLINTIR